MTTTGDSSEAARPSASSPAVEPKFVIEMPSGPALWVAAGIGGYLLRATRTNSWAQLADAVDAEDLPVATRLADYLIDDEQTALLDEWTDVISLIRVDPVRTIAVCDACEQWILVGTRAVPSGCRLTLDCKGKVAKAPRGRKVKIESDDPERSPSDVAPMTRHAGHQPLGCGADQNSGRPPKIEVEETFGEAGDFGF